MSFWSYNKWHAIPDGEFPISPFFREQIQEAGYNLTVGPEVFLPESTVTKVLILKENESFSISPGQFAFILTEENVKLPLNVIGFISVRASIKFYGLVNVSGFHVDPGYDGRLVFAVFNSGPTRITFRRGQPIFAIWLADLDAAIPEEKAPKKGYQHITPEIINKIDGNHLTAYQLSEKIESVLQMAQENKNQMFNYKVYAGIFALLIGTVLIPWIPDSWLYYQKFLPNNEAKQAAQSEVGRVDSLPGSVAPDKIISPLVRPASSTPASGLTPPPDATPP